MVKTVVEPFHDFHVVVESKRPLLEYEKGYIASAFRIAFSKIDPEIEIIDLFDFKHILKNFKSDLPKVIIGLKY